MTITVANRQAGVKFDLRWLRKIARLALAECLPECVGAEPPLSQLQTIEVAIVSDPAIAEVHEKFMQMAGPTDVITFAHGEILISADTAQNNARRFSQTLEHELALYVVHGLLHLNGHDDQSPADAARMRRAQTKVLRRILRQSAS